MAGDFSGYTTYLKRTIRSFDARYEEFKLSLDYAMYNQMLLRPMMSYDFRFHLAYMWENMCVRPALPARTSCVFGCAKLSLPAGIYSTLMIGVYFMQDLYQYFDPFTRNRCRWQTRGKPLASACAISSHLDISPTSCEAVIVALDAVYQPRSEVRNRLTSGHKQAWPVMLLHQFLRERRLESSQDVQTEYGDSVFPESSGPIARKPKSTPRLFTLDLEDVEAESSEDL